MKNVSRAERARLALEIPTKKGMAAALGISPEWYSRLVRDEGAISADIHLRIDDLLRRSGMPGAAPEVASSLLEPSASYASGTATRENCEAYFIARVEEAAASGDPNIWPHLWVLLRRNIPVGFAEGLRGLPEEPSVESVLREVRRMTPSSVSRPPRQQPAARPRKEGGAAR